MERNPAKLVLRPNLVEMIDDRGQCPDTKGGFSLGLAGAGHSFTSACRLMTPDPKEARFSGQGSPGHPWGQAVPGGEG